MQILFVCALFIEAKLLIDEFGLKKIENMKNFQFFGNGDIYLIVTGTRKVNTSVGLTLAIQKLNKNIVHVVSFGLCGSQTDEIGNMFLVNKVTDYDSGRDFYPDNLVRVDLLQKALLTVGKPLVLKNEDKEGLHSVYSIKNSRFWTNQNDANELLIDMEGSAFFETASFFVPVHRIFLLKMVSDNFNQKVLDKTIIQQLLKKQINQINDFVDLLRNCIDKYQVKSSSKFPDNIHLTATQKVNVRNQLHDIYVQKKQKEIEIFWQNVEELIDLEKTPKENGLIFYRFLSEFWEGVYK